MIRVGCLLSGSIGTYSPFPVVIAVPLQKNIEYLSVSAVIILILIVVRVRLLHGRDVHTAEY